MERKEIHKSYSYENVNLTKIEFISKIFNLLKNEKPFKIKIDYHSVPELKFYGMIGQDGEVIEDIPAFISKHFRICGLNKNIHEEIK